MRSRILICLVLICSLLVANASHSKRQQQRIFNDLKNNELGKDIFASIQLELEAGSSENVVTTILNMLYELRNQLSEHVKENKEGFEEKQAECDGRVADIEVQIQELSSKIADAQSKQPVLESAAFTKTQEANEKQIEFEAAQGRISALEEKNENDRAAYFQSVEDHDSMIAALEEAKSLISQLSATGFLQQSQSLKSNLNNHAAKTENKLASHQHIQIFKLLVKMAQNVEIQADQNQVAEILAIIDELIKHEEETANIEAQVESKRQERFEFDKQRLNATVLAVQAYLEDLLADAKTLELKITELNQDIQAWKKQRESKEEQLGLQSKSCSDSLNNVESEVENDQATLEVINQVIEIFESEDIGEIRPVVSDIDYLDA